MGLINTQSRIKGHPPPFAYIINAQYSHKSDIKPQLYVLYMYFKGIDNICNFAMNRILSNNSVKQQYLEADTTCMAQ